LDPKIEDALKVQAEGGVIKKTGRRKKKLDPKIEDALTVQAEGGAIKQYFDKTHRYLTEKLSGKGGRLDSPFCREKMETLMNKYHPSLWNSYIQGRVVDLPEHRADHSGNIPLPSRKDPKADIIDKGGSLWGVSHSEDGFLMSHDSEFHHFAELI